MVEQATLGGRSKSPFEDRYRRRFGHATEHAQMQLLLDRIGHPGGLSSVAHAPISTYNARKINMPLSRWQWHFNGSDWRSDMFRILCLDGGGVRGVFTAAALARIEEQTQKRIVDHFDLICGTSTGGIIAIGLAMGLSAAQLLEFYRERGPVIFPYTSRFARTAGLFRQLFLGPKLSHDALKRELHEVLKDRKFGEAQCRLAIPSYDAVAGRIYVFKTAHHERLINDIDAPAVEVALATSAAPTYFAAASVARDGRFVDGGVWANNPIMVGLVEAVSFLGRQLSEIDVLSIGTTSELHGIAGKEHASALEWNAGLIDLMFAAQAESTLAQAKLLVDGRVHRVNFLAEKGRFSLDDASERAIRELAELGRREVEKKEHTAVISTRFVNGAPVDPFRPVRVPAPAS